VFWEELAKAYEYVGKRGNVKATVKREGKEAVVSFDPEQNITTIVIVLADEPKSALIVP
jgi:hypothetical protein